MELINMVFPALGACVFAWPILGLWFGRQKKAGHPAKRLHQAGLLLFVLYLCGVWWMTGIGLPSSFAPRFALVPFADMFSGPDTFLNVILFLPLGFFLPLLYGRFASLKATAAAGTLLSLLIECLQMFDMGITDVNDLITNAAGTCLGWLLYRCLAACLQDPLLHQFRSCRQNQMSAVIGVILLSLASVALLEKPLAKWLLGLAGLI